MGTLSGVRVLEMAGMGPVPFCGMLLGDMGADVLRIDRPVAPERGIGGAAADLRGRNKRSVQLDLKSAEGRETLLDLVRSADVLIEGYRPGVMERLGLGPEPCLAANRALVYGRATGWGQDGPLAQAAGHDINYIALAGALGMIGAESGPPVPPLNLVGDYGGGALYLAFGVVCALLEARHSSRGQVVDAAMIDGVGSLLTVFRGFLAEGRISGRRGGNDLDGSAPWYAVYETADGEWMAVGALEARFYASFIERLELKAEALPDRSAPGAREVLRGIFAARFRERTRAEWERIFDGSDACVTPVLSLSEAATHPQATARAMTQRFAGVEHPAPAPRFSRTPGALRLAPAQDGADTREGLAAWGIAPVRIEQGLAEGWLRQGDATDHASER
ncbi:MAG: CoA transferase [Rhodobacteraceae bacterium]|jgi:alpha-methylacyl-CoA racemase|uniref:Alpha-methylacyl-CoA racemase n=1 Tax=Salipiger profundus TaxID=1229727 RepID=A0A1U7DA98_9RHOB|nr:MULTISPECIES: CaiB/BaiF CoA-transferase family protein [Salipiger]APX24990.1 alpha-methylacyl-CoA racemase [Salipiger profundus]MAB07903.1 CoA transferase [Paracoccaceae bacterium]GFZ99368.1 CoA transferase [Salipiger profundus]SFC93046.1 alpha-methylacyl-CoA racemase [Salipiger profundus]